MFGQRTILAWVQGGKNFVHDGQQLAQEKALSLLWQPPDVFNPVTLVASWRLYSRERALRLAN